MVKIDTDGNGVISLDEFIAMMQLGEMETDFQKEINDTLSSTPESEIENLLSAPLHEVERRHRLRLEVKSLSDGLNLLEEFY